MILSLWGPRGCGRSALADAVGAELCGSGTILIIDSDLTMPTLPLRTGGASLKPERSLGRFLNRTAGGEVPDFVVQHPDHKGLFYAGLAPTDTFTSCEVSLEASDRAGEFIRRCADVFDLVILDLSSQRTDPFLGATFELAERLLMPAVPDLAFIQFFHSVQKTLEDAGILDRTVLIANAVRPFHLLSDVSEAIGRPFVYQLPFLSDAARLEAEGRFLTESACRAAGFWRTSFQSLVRDLFRPSVDKAPEESEGGPVR